MLAGDLSVALSTQQSRAGIGTFFKSCWNGELTSLYWMSDCTISFEKGKERGKGKGKGIDIQPLTLCSVMPL